MTEYIKPILELVKENETVFDMFVKADSIINESDFERIAVSISGGSDSDVMLDVIHKVDSQKKCKYIYMNTGLEYQATKDQLVYLEKRYGITIERLLPEKPIPVCCKEFGQPFLNKYISEQLKRLQQVNFDFTTTEGYEELVKKYPNRAFTISWWCNKYTQTNPIFKTSQYNINYKSYLKEFIQENPPNFKISNICCNYTKKDVAKKWQKNNNIQLSIIGERKAEGGERAFSSTCTTIRKNGISKYKPLFWLSNEDKLWYEKKFDIAHSKCYTEYGLYRTGCVGCPYGMYYSNERSVTAFYEPKLSKACETVFKDAYAYTEAYYAYRKRKREEAKMGEDQIQFDI